MDPEIFSRIFVRELRSLIQELHAYPDDESVWALPEGVSNSGGTLALHMAGNLRHYLGAVLGRTGYVRDRTAEFHRRDLSRETLVGEARAAIDEIQAALLDLDPARLEEPFPETPTGSQGLSVGAFLVHLASHLSYHLGQLDYHRRIVTGAPGEIEALSAAALKERSG